MAWYLGKTCTVRKTVGRSDTRAAASAHPLARPPAWSTNEGAAKGATAAEHSWKRRAASTDSDRVGLQEGAGGADEGTKQSTKMDFQASSLSSLTCKPSRLASDTALRWCHDMGHGSLFAGKWGRQNECLACLGLVSSHPGSRPKQAYYCGSL